MENHPWRPASSLFEPVRTALRHGVRRSLGVPEEPRPIESDPGKAFLSPDGVTRRVHGDLPAMVIGGLSALLLQSLHPLAMAGVAEHSAYEEDPLGRLRRTADFVGATTFGTKKEARRAIARVQKVHLRVEGTAPDGRPYSANDPELITWVHVAEMWSFLEAAQRYGRHRLTPSECDEYFAETSVLAREMGAAWAPTSRDEAEAYFHRSRGELYAGSQALAARDFLLRGVARNPQDRAIHGVIAGAAVSILPRWARKELRLPDSAILDAALVGPTAWAWCVGLRWVITPPPGPARGTDARR